MHCWFNIFFLVELFSLLNYLLKIVSLKHTHTPARNKNAILWFTLKEHKRAKQELNKCLTKQNIFPNEILSLQAWGTSIFEATAL